MNIKALILGTIVGLTVALIPSCGGTGKCGPANCAGCCDPNGLCLTDPTASKDSTCGSQGNACVDCTTTKATCEASTHRCVGGTDGGAGTGGSATGGGTGGGSTGGGTGGSSTGGGTGGGSTGGGTGGGAGSACTPASPSCPTGEECMLTDTTPSFNCYPGACNVVTQDCADTSKHCVYADVGSGAGRNCVASTGTLTQGQACTPSNDQCAKGYICASQNGTTGTCAKFCLTSANCDANSECNIVISINGITEKPMVCGAKPAACDPLLQNCTATTDGCFLTASGPGCAPAGSIADGASCNTANGCTKGSICVGSTTGACHKVCNLDGGLPHCASGSCTPITSQPYGACN